ncbi:hypothetical protein KC19_3G079400 [Ceratodon purpureus]|uniref:Uncharacterized protein n=1 Tax=Ceratodon purpureus TaxID=3225 RepID=A0A8T0IHA9_CERPU|nr:hypothetical protein KC19_3G079400 [Ceratodon purpureus]
MSTPTQSSVWSAFVLVIWALRLLFQKLSDRLCVWACQQWESNSIDNDLSSSGDSEEIIDQSPRVSQPSFDCEAQLSSPPFSASVSSRPSVQATPVASPSHGDLEWHVLNFCRLDAPGYRRAAQRHRWKYLSFTERLRAETVHFQFLLSENMCDFELPVHSSARPVPSYVSLRDCPPDYTVAPGYYEI